MKILVLIKQILDPAGITVNRRRERIFTERAERIINPADAGALEAALQLQESAGGEVIAISLGPAEAEDALREALALGADAAYLLSDAALAATDEAGAARALARAAERIGGYDLILAGAAAADTGGAQVAGRLAELLDLPQVGEAVGLELAGDGLIALRRWDGRLLRVQTPLPAVVALGLDAPLPRLPHGARIMDAYRRWTVTTWTSADLGLSAEELAPLVESRGLQFPPARELGVKISGAPAEVAAEIVAQLRARRLL